MEEWKEYKLGEVIKLSSGGTPNKSNASYWGGDIPWISAKSMYDDYLYSSDIAITNEGLNNGSKLAPINSILLLTRGSGLFNRIPVCLVKREMAYNQDVKCVESSNQDIVSNLFLFYWLMGNKLEISNILETTGIGAGKIDTERFKNITIQLPPIEIQRVLINFAESIMLKIEVNRRINENLEAQAQALFKSWFVDFEPFRNGEFVESELGMIPKGWKNLSFKDFIIASNEKAPVDSLPEYSVTNSGIIPRDSKFNKKLSKSSSMNKVLRKDNLVFGMSRDILNWGIMEDEIGGVSSAYNVYIIDMTKVNPTYLRLFMAAKISYFHSLIGTAAREGQSLDKGQLMLKNIYIPQYIILQNFLSIYQTIKNKMSNNEQESRRLAALRDTLLPRLMSGELKVNEIEREIQ